jgi:hypothetical protein
MKPWKGFTLVEQEKIGGGQGYLIGLLKIPIWCTHKVIHEWHLRGIKEVAKNGFFFKG